MPGDEVATGRRMFVAGLTASMFTIVLPSFAFADRKRRRENEDEDDDDDYGHDAARRARTAGKIVPLSEIIDQVQKAHDGEVVGVELEREDGRWVYEIKVITRRNQYLEIYVDARDRTVIKVEGE